MFVVFVIAVSTHFRSVLRAVFERSENPNVLSTDCHEYSPAYPSLGGAGCSLKCLSDGKQNLSYGAVYYNNTHRWPSDLLSNMHHAGELLKKYGPVSSLDTERNCYLHVALDYFCCYSPEEAVKIGEFINNYDWRPQEVRFDRLVCAIHSTGSMVSLVLMLDDDSQARLLQHTLNSSLV